MPETGHRVSKRKALNLDRIKVNHEIAKDRYYYHRRLDKTIFMVDGATRIINCNYKSLEEIPEGTRGYNDHKVGQRHYITQLIRLGYNVQYKLI